MNERVAELQTAVGDCLIFAYSIFDWEVITLFYGNVGQLSGWWSECIDANGDKQYASTPREVSNALASLKKELATTEHGTWISVNVTIRRSTGQFNIAYNYDEKPEWDPEPQSENYLLEMERYPRPADEIPEWFPKPEDYPNWHDELER